MPPENNTPQETETLITSSPAPKKPSISIPAAIIAGAAIIAIAVIFTLNGSKLGNKTAAVQQQQQNDQQPTSVPSDVAKLRPDDYIRGSKNADVLVIEYSDSDCPYCQKFHPELQQAVTDYKGKVAWVYRFFPLSIHPNAYTEALALSCVGDLGGNDAFWNYLDTIINVTLAPDPKSNEALITFATQDGIDAATLKTCLKNSASTKKIDDDTAEAQKIGAKGTPFSIAVNQKTGKQVIIPGAVPADYLKQLIDSVL